jgi:hypothetical protein
MAKRPMTNIEKVTHIMSHGNYGTLIQCFVMEALHRWSAIISKADPREVDNCFVSGEAGSELPASFARRCRPT